MIVSMSPYHTRTPIFLLLLSALQLTLSPSPQKKFFVRMFWNGYSVFSSNEGP